MKSKASIKSEGDPELLKSPSFYKLLDGQGEVKYVGSTKDPKRRLYIHSYHLAQGKHLNKQLQSHIDHCGELVFSPLIAASKDALLHVFPTGAKK